MKPTHIISTCLSLLAGSLLLVTQAARAGDWATVASPNSGKQANNLSGIAAVTDSSVWAVGFAYNQQLLAYQTLIEHWDGARWSIARSPNASTGYNLLNGIAVTSATDIWAVGNSFASNIYSTLVEHWNGRQWQIIPSPNVAGVSNILQSVSVISPNDVWAVGYTQTSNIFRPLSLHWDGTAWSNVAIAGQGRLLSVDGVASNDIWATGETEPGEQSLTMHWDGAAWTTVPSPNDSTEDNLLWGVTAISSNDVWAVGAAGSLKTLAIHWDGVKWSLVPTPGFTGQVSNQVLVGIVALASNDIWAVGQYLLPLQGSAEQTLTEHWDGASWSIVSSPDAKNSNNRLAAVTVTPNGTLWSSGTVGVFAKPERTLILNRTP